VHESRPLPPLPLLCVWTRRRLRYGADAAQQNGKRAVQEAHHRSCSTPVERVTGSRAAAG